MSETIDHGIDRPPQARQAGIVDAAFHLPGPAQDIEAWAERVGVERALVERLLANGCRHFHVADSEDDAELCAAATRMLLERHDLDPARVPYVVHAHTQSYSVPPAPQSLLAQVARRCGLRPRLAMSVGELACGGIVKALEIALDLLEADPAAGHALVLSSDRVFGGPRHRIRQEAGIQSDGGAAILLGRQRLRARVLDIRVRHWPGLALGPQASPKARLMGALPWAHTRRLWLEMASRAGVAPSALGRVFPTNADGPYWRELAHGMGLKPGTLFLDNMRRRGHSCCSDLAINLADAVFDELAAGRRALCFSQSNVGAYGALALEGVAS